MYNKSIKSKIYFVIDYDRLKIFQIQCLWIPQNMKIKYKVILYDINFDPFVNYSI